MHFLQPGSQTLVLCAHPDDEIGCGAFINKLIENGESVHYVYFSNCAESTRSLGFEPERLIEECHESCRQLGIKLENVSGFDFPVRHFPQHRQEILETLIVLRKKINPALVLVASRDDVHQDHSTLTHEAIRAFKHSTIIGYEFPWNHMHSHLDMLVRVEQRHIDAKIRAWSSYKTQAARAYHGQKVLESLARVRGVQANTEFAESYETIRVFM
jgi:LmbE family N-acetylglucosaminyl deacetylase